MNPEATITIPVYNSEKFIPKCLESALSQNTKRNYEVLVINDGSTDNTEKILDEFSKKNKDKLRVIHQKNAGVGITRNRLLGKSRGNVLITLDSDDYLSENALEKTINYFNSNPKTNFVYS